MNPQAIIASIPMLRRIWRILPRAWRVPLLLIAAAIGVVQFILGRRSAQAASDTA